MYESKIIDINGIELISVNIDGTFNIRDRDTSNAKEGYYMPLINWNIKGISGSDIDVLEKYLYSNVIPTKTYSINIGAQYTEGVNAITMLDSSGSNFIINANNSFKWENETLTYTKKITTPIGTLTTGGTPSFPKYLSVSYYEYHCLITDNNNNSIIVHIGFLWRQYSTTINIPTYLWVAYGINGTWNDTIYSINNIYSKRNFDNTSDSTTGGGYGLGSMPTDNIIIPELPVINMSDTGATLYSLTAAQMKAFRSWLWSTNWVDNLKKIRTDPMQNIIGISVVDIPITAGLNALVYVGNVASTVEANVVSNSFVELDCGEISLDEYYGSFADYEPFIATTLYLPKVGFIQIPADVCVNNTIKVVYHIELSSGEGLCYVQLTSKRDGFTYIWNTYTCHVTSNITLSAQDHSQQLVALGNAIINTGISASNAIVNPAAVAQGLTNTLSSCIDVATTKNPTSTKGNVGNMSAVMCYKKPYLLINRTNLTKPSSFQENNGYLINYTATIGGHTGFLQTRNYHCSFNAPYSHRAEIERLMDGGIIINA